MRSRWTIGLGSVLVTVAGLRLLLSPTVEPIYAGKSVSQWLDAGYEDCAMAIQEIGPAAAPYVLAKLAREDARYGRAMHYRRLRAGLPSCLQGIVPQPATANFDEIRACSLLLEIGPKAIPVLADGLRNNNPAVRSVCARTLGSLRQRGCEVGAAFPLLIEVARDQNTDVRASAAWVAGAPTFPPAQRR